MKYIIAGGREFGDYALLKRTLNKYLKPGDIIVSGKARGADRLGEAFAREFNFTIKEFPANWDMDGKSAGYIRNLEMAEYADAAIIFWDGKSRGTRHMIDTMDGLKKLRYVVHY